MNQPNEQKHSVGVAIFLLVMSPVFAFGLFAWAGQVAEGYRTISRRRQALADLMEGFLAMIGQSGALVLGIGVIIAAVGYLIFTIQLRRSESQPATARPTHPNSLTSASSQLHSSEARWTGRNDRSAASTGSRKCSKCGLLLSQAEAKSGHCPKCSKG